MYVCMYVLCMYVLCMYVCMHACMHASPELGAKVNWQWGQVGWMLADHRNGLSSSSFLAWSSIAQSVCQRAFSLLAIWCLGPRDQILHSAEEHNLSPFDLNIACLCQSIELNNNKHVCMYVCMYVCIIYVCIMYVCMYVCMHACMHRQS